MIDIDYLRRTATPQWFGLGFIQLKLDAQARMHFWHPTLKPDVGEEELHDHRYDFASEIIHGEITHKVFEFSPNMNGHYEKVQVSCDPLNPAPQHGTVRGHIKYVGEYNLVKGSSYRFERDQFHQTSASKAITIVHREKTRKEFANVLRRVGAPAICAFERKIPENDLWEIIESFLPAAEEALEEHKLPGYHLDTIPKGEVGEISKIIEEALELRDFERQETAVGMLVELCDLVGSVEAYLAKHHPTIALNDLKKFADITKRAFVNGHRG